MTASVPRQLVHRASIAETFPTGWTRTETDRFSVSAQWPRVHCLHVSPDRTAYDPLLVVETVRQAGTLLNHTEYKVPLDHQFVLQEFRITTFAEHLGVGPAPAEPVVDITFSDVRHRGKRLVSARYEADVRLDGERVAHADVAFTCTSGAVFSRLRGGRTAATVTPLPLPPGLAAADVGRDSAADVVLAPPQQDDGNWQLRVDTGHAVFFDHPLDHIPGMLLLEAARQAALARTGLGSRRIPVSFDTTFHQFAELDLPTWIDSTDEGGGALKVVGTQEGRTIFECVVGTAERSAILYRQ
ncbi:ScbA/BarX family gamma-butyrolactone biosynthesis protein [Streptomyces turgidiscabies]|uniref:ScbA/BarX family gamma-butyrolactone biosynthesis protein n=1 Tax=Streptomyces TaxID=1883 RepID=UPI0005CB42ED|nr:MULTISPECIES: ScbA/BarX family gamma-butyrolactone biosynthesis protein [Streptomyces]MDX3495087.1 ScbA/BarX family gamma-butyrolactone biosynthesis protein [Streptomyces turgidiscabies]GAQ70960.1 A-factor biosynthesis hotdog domain protein [Streptomyces turgidiscabies]